MKRSRRRPTHDELVALVEAEAARMVRAQQDQIIRKTIEYVHIRVTKHDR